MGAPVVLWFRNDLRLADNPALVAAVAAGRPIVALFVLDDLTPGPWRRGAASRWFLAGALESLAAAIAERGGRLILRRGAGEEVVEELVRRLGAEAVFWNRRYEPWAVGADRRLKERLRARRVRVESFNAQLGFEPFEIRQADGGPYKVYTPFSRAWTQREPPPPPWPVPEALRLADPEDLPSDRLEDWELRPTKPDWAAGLRESWEPSEAGAQRLLRRFLDGPVYAYGRERDFPGRPGVSRLSPHLAVGTIGPRQILTAVRTRALADGRGEGAVWPFVRQLIWRDFAYHALFHFPELPDRPLRAEFARFPWADDAALLRAWRRGRTGYPIVDAGMRELWHTGYLHNRMRMIVGSFLTKDLLIPWQEGERWFWDTLVDADLANNAMGWQWVAGCGIDAAPYFRIFNPVLQAEKFDPDGAYVRRWVPELARLPDAWIHEPWAAPPAVLEAAGVRLGETYPLPIVDHERARARALEAFAALRR